MSKFNKPVKTGVTSPVKTVGKTVNASGLAAFARDEKSELFLLAVSNFVGKDTFYENAKNRDDRFATLSAKVAVADPRWFQSFVGWLRNDAFMRSASTVAAAEGVNAILKARGVLEKGQTWEQKIWTPKGIVAASMARADEPGEFLAYWISKFGKKIPAAVKKGVELGAQRLYNEYSLLKYDTESKGFRFADVIQLSHAEGIGEKQNALFRYALDRRYGNDERYVDGLPLVNTRRDLMAMDVKLRKNFISQSDPKEVQAFLKNAGMTWESLSGWLQGPMDSAAWEAIIPSMPYMALLRNLRNFQQAGVSQSVLNGVLARLSDPAEVAKSKQFPFRFLAAYNANQGNLKVMSALEDALQASLANVPYLDGNTLILVDRSASMFHTDSGQELSRADQAAIFGIALALRAQKATLVQYGGSWYGSNGAPESKVVNFKKGDSIMPLLDKFENMGNTNTVGAIQRHLTDKHDRVILITDEQHNGSSRQNPGDVVPAKVPMYTWNLEGYRAAHSESGKLKRHSFGGLTDKGFQMIPLIEAGQSQKWPWEVAKQG